MFFTPDYTETQGIHATKFKTETTSAVAPIKKNWTSKVFTIREPEKLLFFLMHLKAQHNDLTFFFGNNEFTRFTVDKINEIHIQSFM